MSEKRGETFSGQFEKYLQTFDESEEYIPSKYTQFSKDDDTLRDKIYTEFVESLEVELKNSYNSKFIESLNPIL